MPERSAVATASQIGVETTEGTAVAANKILNSLDFTFSPQIAANLFRPQGTKFATVSAPGQEWTQLGVQGRPVYDELQYVFSSLLTTAVITSPDATTGSPVRKWTFTPSSVAEDNPKSYTVEQGSPVRAHRVVGARFTDFSLAFNAGRESLDLGGSAMAKAIQDGITMTTGPAALPLIPVLPTQVSFFLNNTASGIGTTKLTRVLAANLAFNGRFGPVSAYDSAEASYAALVETEPDFTIELTPAADAQGMGLLPDLRSGVTRFMRIVAIGPVIANGFNYRLQIDAAVKVRDPGEFSDEDGVFVLPFTFQLVHDSGFGKALEVQLTNAQASL